MILEIVAIVLIILLLLVLAILLVPFGVKLDASFSLSTAKVDIAFSWLGLTLWRVKPSQPQKKEEKKMKPAERRKSGVGRTIQMISLLRESIPALAILGKAAKRAVRLRRLNADFEIGLGDPADTALLAGYIWTFSWLLNRLPKVSFSFRPNFETLQLESSVRAEARVRMLPLAIGFLRAYTKKSFRRLIKEARRR